MENQSPRASCSSTTGASGGSPAILGIRTTSQDRRDISGLTQRPLYHEMDPRKRKLWSGQRGTSHIRQGNNAHLLYSQAKWREKTYIRHEDVEPISEDAQVSTGGATPSSTNPAARGLNGEGGYKRCLLPHRLLRKGTALLLLPFSREDLRTRGHGNGLLEQSIHIPQDDANTGSEVAGTGNKNRQLFGRYSDCWNSRSNPPTYPDRHERSERVRLDYIGREVMPYSQRRTRLPRIPSLYKRHARNINSKEEEKFDCSRDRTSLSKEGKPDSGKVCNADCRTGGVHLTGLCGSGDSYSTSAKTTGFGQKLGEGKITPLERNRDGSKCIGLDNSKNTKKATKTFFSGNHHDGCVAEEMGIHIRDQWGSGSQESRRVPGSISTDAHQPVGVKDDNSSNTYIWADSSGKLGQIRNGENRQQSCYVLRKKRYWRNSTPRRRGPKTVLHSQKVRGHGACRVRAGQRKPTGRSVVPIYPVKDALRLRNKARQRLCFSNLWKSHDIPSDERSHEAQSDTHYPILGELNMVPHPANEGHAGDETRSSFDFEALSGAKGRTLSLGAEISYVLSISEEIRCGVYPNSTITRLGLAFAELARFVQRVFPDVMYVGNIFERAQQMSLEQKILFMQQTLRGLPRPKTRRNQINRLFNIIEETSNPSALLEQRFGLNWVKSKTIPNRVSKKTTINIAKFLSFWKNAMSSHEDWLDIRNDAIITMFMITGRRGANIARMDAPIYHFRDEVFHFTEFGSKGDPEHEGFPFVIYRSSDPSFCPVRIIQRYLDHPKTVELASLWKRQKDYIPLFFQDPEARELIPLTGKRINSVAKEYLKKAGCRTDNVGRKVSAKNFRHTHFTRATLGKIRSEYILAIQARKQGLKVGDIHYSEDGTYFQFSDFMFYLRNKCDSELDDWITVNNIAELHLQSLSDGTINLIPTSSQDRENISILPLENGSQDVESLNRDEGTTFSTSTVDDLVDADSQSVFSVERRSKIPLFEQPLIINGKRTRTASVKLAESTSS